VTLYFLEIPPFQRTYVWDEHHVEQLITDFIDALDNGITPYFLGSVVLHKQKKDHYDIVDGQGKNEMASPTKNKLRK